jgi:hypothetical protein
MRAGRAVRRLATRFFAIWPARGEQCSDPFSEPLATGEQVGGRAVAVLGG